MFAKLYFDSGWLGNDILPVLHAVLTGTTNLVGIPGATAKFIPSLSYCLTNKNAAGWTTEFTNSTTKVISAPCKDSAKKKYARLNLTSNHISLELLEAGGWNPSTGAVVGGAPQTPNDVNNYPIYASANNTIPHNTSSAVEVWVSASARHFVIAANQPGYQHGAGFNGGRSGGWVTGVVEHTPADSWITESSSYVPACVMSAENNTAAANVGVWTFYRTRSRQISNPVATYLTGTTAGAKLEGYTKYGSGQIGNITLNGSNLVLLDENTAVRTLLPFGVRSKAGLVRGGSVTELCDLYLAPANIFKENLQIQVGDNVNNKYHVWNLGFSASATVGYNLLVPRG